MNKFTKKEFFNWLSEHEQASEDFCNHFYIKEFADMDVDSLDVSLDQIIDWVCEHDELLVDMLVYFTQYDADYVSDRLDELLDKLISGYDFDKYSCHDTYIDTSSLDLENNTYDEHTIGNQLAEYISDNISDQIESFEWDFEDDDSVIHVYNMTWKE